MRIFTQIFIILFVILSLFIVKDDIISVYKNTVSYFKNENITPSSIVKNILSQKSLTSGIDNVNTTSKDLLTNQKSLNTPGPLRVLDSLLVSSSNNTNLIAKNVILLTNQSRKENGDLPPLKENSKLNFSAEKKLQDMFMKQYFEHISPSGVGVGDLGNEISYEYIIIGENLALGNFKDDKALVDAWMASPGHRANILNKRYVDIGVAVGHGMFEGRDTWMAVQHFGLPKSACPNIDEVLKGIIALDQKRIKEMESDLLVRRSNIDSGVVFDGLSHNEQIDKYNSLVAIYNQLITETKQKISTYNDEVKAFNSCVGTNTTAHS